MFSLRDELWQAMVVNRHSRAKEEAEVLPHCAPFAAPTTLQRHAAACMSMLSRCSHVAVGMSFATGGCAAAEPAGAAAEARLLSVFSATFQRNEVRGRVDGCEPGSAERCSTSLVCTCNFNRRRGTAEQAVECVQQICSR